MPNGYIPAILYFIRDMIMEKKNPLGLSGADCSKWAEGLNIPRGGETILYTSCMYQIMSYSESLVEMLSKFMGDPTTSFPIKLARLSMKLKVNPVKVLSKFRRGRDYDEIVRKGAEILKKIGVSFGYLYEEEPYSGTLLYEYGFHDDFAVYANEIYKFFKSKNVREIITIDPHTADLLKNVYPEFVEGFDIEVRTFIEIVKEAIEDGRLRLKEESNETTLIYHDPCHFSKYLGIINEPRDVLKSIKGVELVEHDHSREMSVCCGGPIESLYPKLSKVMAKSRLDELLYTGARKIVVACPICLANFDRARDLIDEEYEVIDIIEFIYDHMGD